MAPLYGLEARAAEGVRLRVRGYTGCGPGAGGGHAELGCSPGHPEHKKMVAGGLSSPHRSPTRRSSV